VKKKQCLSDPKTDSSEPYAEPVHRHDDGTWWFWDELCQHEYGAYTTKAEANRACEAYARTL
jgi:hypothetical protein